MLSEPASSLHLYILILVEKREHESIQERRFRERKREREYLVATKPQDESSSTCQTNCWNCDKLMIKYTAEVYSGVSESTSHQNLRFTEREREKEGENETSKSETDIKTPALCNEFPVTSKKEADHRDYSGTTNQSEFTQ